MTLNLSIKPQYLNQILRGTKTNEYRKVNDYYTRRLVREKSDEKPEKSEGFVRCSDGRWRKFHVYDKVRFLCGGRVAEYSIRTVDVEGSNYVLRLGKQIK